MNDVQYNTWSHVLARIRSRLHCTALHWQVGQQFQHNLSNVVQCSDEDVYYVDGVDLATAAVEVAVSMAC